MDALWRAFPNHHLKWWLVTYAMYMKNPQRILDTFMVRHDGYRVRIDDVQHNIGGYYLYCINYDKLVQYGMLICADVFGGQPVWTESDETEDSGDLSNKIAFDLQSILDNQENDIE